MPHKLHMDVETCSKLNLATVGAHRYAADPSTRALCVAWAYDDDRVQSIFLPNANDITSIFSQASPETIICAWNKNFERNILVNLWGILPARWSCSMQRALYAGLPGKLEKAALAINAPFQKDMAGHRLMMKMAKPRPDGSFWHQDPDKTLARQMLYDLADYCRLDVETERAVAKLLPELPNYERAISILDELINNRGIGIDKYTVERLIDISEEETRNLNRQATNVSHGAVTSPGTQSARLASWFANHGILIPSVDKANIAEVLDLDDLPDHVREMALIRQRVAKSSTKKLKPMLAARDTDGRLRGSLQYYGAKTGRWAGRIVQPQNMPSRNVIKNANKLIADLRKPQCDADYIRAFYGEPMHAVSSCLRGCFIPRPGNSFIVFDFAQIEARCLAWLAGQQDLLDLFAQDADVYTETANRLGLGSRDAGKVAVLSLGYGTGWRKFIEMAAGYGIELDEIESQRIVTAWREDNQRTVQFWYDVDNVFRRCIPMPSFRGGTGLRLRSLLFHSLKPIVRNSPYPLITIDMPHGERCLYYHEARFVPDPDRPHPAIVIDGLDQKTNQWGPIRTWGAKLVENITQAMARDVMALVARRVESNFADVQTVLTVHDELVFEVPADAAEGYLGTLRPIIEAPLNWAPGLPVKATGKIMQRYGK